MVTKLVRKEEEIGIQGLKNVICFVLHLFIRYKEEIISRNNLVSDLGQLNLTFTPDELNQALKELAEEGILEERGGSKIAVLDRKIIKEIWQEFMNRVSERIGQKKVDKG